MCGRFTQFHSWAEIHALYNLTRVEDIGRNTAPRYNIAPTQDVLFVCNGEEGQVVLEGRWWLVPHWAKEMPKWTLFNARSEDAHTKNSFRDAFKTRRCLIPADGWYEWTKNEEDGGKDPHFISLADAEPFSFAGLWAHNTKLGVTSCTILTAAADPNIADIHSRMPIVLKETEYDRWLDRQTTVDDARQALTHHRAGEMQSWRVSREVNKNTATGAYLIEPINRR